MLSNLFFNRLHRDIYDLNTLMKVKLRFQANQYDKTKESVLVKAAQYLSHLIDLPQVVVIELANLDHSVYGHTTLTQGQQNIVRLNNRLSAKELLFPLIHELIHLHQVHSGKLKAYRDGTFLWEGHQYKITEAIKADPKKYNQLPWEIDVANKERLLLEKVLNFTSTT